MTKVGTGYMRGMQRHFPSCRNGWRKAKTHFELKLAKEVKGRKTAFCKNVIRRRMDRPLVQWGKRSNMGHAKAVYFVPFLPLKKNQFIKHIKIRVSIFV